MGDRLHIGFNMNPKWVGDRSLQRFLEPLRAEGLDTLEFELDSHLPEWEQVPPMMDACAKLGYQLCFHAPYRKPNRMEGFARDRRKEVVDRYRPMLFLASDWAKRQQSPVNVVVHGAHSHSIEREALEEDTLRFLEWILIEFPELRLAFEINHPPQPGEIKIGDSRSSVVEIIKKLEHPRVGICWDMGHDYLYQKQELLEDDWLARIFHAHVHDVDEKGVDHYPLLYGRVPYAGWLPALRSCPAQPTVTLEVKGRLLTGWSWEKIAAALSGSIRIIREATG